MIAAAPAAVKVRHVSAPMPLAPPVMSATRPSNRKGVMFPSIVASFWDLPPPNGGCPTVTGFQLFFLVDPPALRPSTAGFPNLLPLSCCREGNADTEPLLNPCPPPQKTNRARIAKSLLSAPPKSKSLINLHLGTAHPPVHAAPPVRTVSAASPSTPPPQKANCTRIAKSLLSTPPKSKSLIILHLGATHPSVNAAPPVRTSSAPSPSVPHRVRQDTPIPPHQKANRIRIAKSLLSASPSSKSLINSHLELPSKALHRLAPRSRRHPHSEIPWTPAGHLIHSPLGQFE